MTHTSSVLPFPVREDFLAKSLVPELGAGSASASTPLAGLLDRYDRPGPRYTSYPTIDQCGESEGAQTYLQALQGRQLGSLHRPLSLYVHIPFCASVCYYCACNKVITKKRDQVASYLNSLENEAMWVSQATEAMSPVVQFHMGGGTPTFLTDGELSDLVLRLSRHFPIAKHAERSIEVDPRTVDEGRLTHLRHLGFNRISFGVQDFDPQVQKAVHREQSAESVRALVQHARALGFESINVDLIYGLPLQTLDSFSITLKQLIELQADRVAMYGYAHLPERFKPQRRIHTEDLPNAARRVEILALAIDTLQKAGFDYIGMDHFAKPSDPLAKARRQGVLHRNFQGYTTQPEADLVGLGVSAISKVGATLLQNSRSLEEYQYAVDSQGTAVFRGHVSDRDDLIRQSVIMGLLCQGAVDYEDFLQVHWEKFENYFARELEALREFEQDGFVLRDDKGIRLTELGWFFVRPIAMTFDRYVRRGSTQRSKVL